jgi:hypothetical protein
MFYLCVIKIKQDMRGKQYDIFISYRRSDGTNIARLFKSEFEKRGYRAFLDFDDLADGKFDKKIENAILDAPIFLMILTNDYFARCNDKDDWVRREIECALENEKVIVPVNYDGNLNGIPDYLEPNLKNEIGLHQFSTIDAGVLFVVSFNKMIEDRVAKVIGIISNDDPQPQAQPRPRPKPAQTDFNTEYNRCMTTEQYPEAFALCLNEVVVRGSVDPIKSKADKAIEKLKGRILIPDCVAFVSYDWLIDRLSEKGYSPIKLHKNSISYKKIRFRISKAGSGISEVKIKFYVSLFSKFIVLLGFFILSFAVFLTLNQMFFENYRLVTWVHSGAHKPFFIFGIMIEAIYIVFFVTLIRFIIRFFKRKKKAIQDVAKICLEESER